MVLPLRMNSFEFDVGSDYFEVLKSWPLGRVATNKIIVNLDRGSMAVWPRGRNPQKNPNPFISL